MDAGETETAAAEDMGRRGDQKEEASGADTQADPKATGNLAGEARFQTRARARHGSAGAAHGAADKTGKEARERGIAKGSVGMGGRSPSVGGTNKERGLYDADRVP